VVEGGCIGVIEWNVWMAPVKTPIDSAVHRNRDCRGIVLDLRGNPGGIAGMLMGVAGHFYADTITLGRLESRSGELRFVANPQRVSPGGTAVQPYGGPVAILLDALSVSTTEMFASGMQSTGRARVFGETSAGQALPAVATRLPNHDVLMYVIADATGPAGERVEGVGVVPDQPVPLRRADLIQGRDAPLEAAIAWILSQNDGT
jgi:carboxyl-terminal processing protease